MDFFEKLGETISSKGKQVAQKAKDLTELAKLNGQISTEEEIMKNAYLSIGKMFYEECKENPVGDYATEVEIIKESTEKIKKLEYQVHQLKGIINCPNCGESISVNSYFCSSCGAKLEQEDKTSDENEEEITDELTDESGDIVVEIFSTCPLCGGVISEDDEFCPSCGKKLVENDTHNE
jgi:predicted nucleic acid-binding Zn ribbon protein